MSIKSVYHLEYAIPLVPIPWALPLGTGVVSLGLTGGAVWRGHWCRVGSGVVSLGISWMQRYSLLSGTVSLSHIGSSNPAVGRSSSSSLESAASTSGGVSLKISHWQASGMSQDEGLLWAAM